MGTEAFAELASLLVPGYQVAAITEQFHSPFKFYRHQPRTLHLVVDLGVWWQEKTGLPLPLGGNAVRRDLGTDTIRQISRLLKESIRYALDHRQDALAYALRYARDMDMALADKFVGMYVNDWTLDYGPRGREAVQRLLEEGHKAGVIPNPRCPVQPPACCGTAANTYTARERRPEPLWQPAHQAVQVPGPGRWPPWH